MKVGVTMDDWKDFLRGATIGAITTTSYHVALDSAKTAFIGAIAGGIGSYLIKRLVSYLEHLHNKWSKRNEAKIDSIPGPPPSEDGG